MATTRTEATIAFLCLYIYSLVGAITLPGNHDVYLMPPVVAPDGNSFSISCNCVDFMKSVYQMNPTFGGSITVDFYSENTKLHSVTFNPGALVCNANLIFGNGGIQDGALNSNFTCQVSTNVNKRNLPPESVSIESKELFLGFKVQPNPLIVKEGERTTVEIISTIPILCKNIPDCCVTMNLRVPSNKNNIAAITKCNYDMCTSDWDVTSHQAVTKIPLVANKDPADDVDKDMTVAFDPLTPAGGGQVHQLLKNLKVPEVDVKLTNEEYYTCTITGDPHIHTFQNMNSMLHLYEMGEFMFYSNPHHDVEIHGKTWPCNNRASCLCSLIIRQGREILRVSICDEIKIPQHISWMDYRHRMSYALQNTHMSLKTPNGGLPDGAQVLTDDEDKYMQCQHCTDVTTTLPPGLFGGSFKVEVLIVAAGGYTIVNKRGASANANTTVPGNTTVSGNSPDDQNSTVYFTFDADEYIAAFPEYLAPTASGPVPLDNATEESIRQKCTRAIEGSVMMGLCQQLDDVIQTSIEECIDDYAVTRQEDMVLSSVHAFNMLCQVHLERDPANYEIGPDGVRQLRDAVTSMSTCSQTCSAHGVCQNGTCVCDPGWTGNHCSIDLNATTTAPAATTPSPQTTTALGQTTGTAQMCDVSTNKCTDVNLSPPPGLSVGDSVDCKFETSVVSNTVTSGVINKAGDCECPLPKLNVGRNIDKHPMLKPSVIELTLTGPDPMTIMMSCKLPAPTTVDLTVDWLINGAKVVSQPLATGEDHVETLLLDFIEMLLGNPGKLSCQVEDTSVSPLRKMVSEEWTIV